MTVAQLIEQLSKLPPDKEILIQENLAGGNKLKRIDDTDVAVWLLPDWLADQEHRNNGKCSRHRGV